MFVNAPVSLCGSSETSQAKFLVNFYHTKPKKGHSRKCICSIYICSSDDAETVSVAWPYNQVTRCDSPKHPETKSKMLLVEAYAQCETTDNYSKAYGRLLSMKRALRACMYSKYINNTVSYLCPDNPFRITNDTFKAFTHQLNDECGSGKELAIKLQQTEGYNLAEETH